VRCASWKRSIPSAAASPAPLRNDAHLVGRHRFRATREWRSVPPVFSGQFRPNGTSATLEPSERRRVSTFRRHSLHLFTLRRLCRAHDARSIYARTCTRFPSILTDSGPHQLLARALAFVITQKQYDALPRIRKSSSNSELQARHAYLCRVPRARETAQGVLLFTISALHPC